MELAEVEYFSIRPLGGPLAPAATLCRSHRQVAATIPRVESSLEPVALALGVTCAGLIWQAEMLRDRVEREEAKMKE
jgi:hypothetical protein